MVIEVIGKQYQWTIRYPGKDKVLGKNKIIFDSITNKKVLEIDKSDSASKDDFFTNEIHLIKGVKTVFTLESLDILHSFYMPYQRLKMDCIPGIISRISFMPNQTSEEAREKLSKELNWKRIDLKTNLPQWKNFVFELNCADCCLYHRRVDSICHKNKVIIEDKIMFDNWAKKQKTIFDN